MLFGWLHAVPPIILASVLPGVVTGTIYWLMKLRRTVYLIDYSCFSGSANCRVPIATFIEHMHLTPFIDKRSLRFMTRMLESSGIGIGDESQMPPTIHYIPAYRSFSEACVEAELVVFSAIDDLLGKTGVAPDAVGILVVNCSIFAPVPSITDMIVNRYKLRGDIRAVNLSGMGCSAGVVSVGLAASLLQATGNGAHARVVSTETITSNFYVGKERSMQLTNILFRVGGAAMLLSVRI